MDVSVIIVNYNTRTLLADCLNSIYAQTNGLAFEVIVSDNGSADGSIEMLKEDFPQVILIENNANLGFGAANNRGLAVAKGKYIFYLNSDTVLFNNAIKMFFDYFEKNAEKENLGALGCNLLNVDGGFNSSYADFPDVNKNIVDSIKANYGLWKLFVKKLFGRPLSDTTKKKALCEKKIGKVDFIVGADLFLLNDDFARFDENIFLYCEETDLQFQIAKTGKCRILIDGPEIAHLEGSSSKDLRCSYFEELTSFYSKCNNIHRIYYYNKNISKIKAQIIKLLTLLMWLNPLIIKYNYKAIPALLRGRVCQKDLPRLLSLGAAQRAI